MEVGVLALHGDFREHAAAVAQLDGSAVLVRRGGDLEGLWALILPGGGPTTIGCSPSATA